jgi:hypothetical protein
MGRIKLKNFFLVEAGTTFKDPSELGPTPSVGGPGMTQGQKPQEVNRLQTLPASDAKKLQQIERMCHELAQTQEGDPDLKQVVHRFLLDLNKWMGEGG